MAQPEGEETKKAAPIPITEESTNHRKIPKVVFIENIDGWVEKYTEDVLF